MQRSSQQDHINHQRCAASDSERHTHTHTRARAQPRDVARTRAKITAVRLESAVRDDHGDDDDNDATPLVDSALTSQEALLRYDAHATLVHVQRRRSLTHSTTHSLSFTHTLTCRPSYTFMCALTLFLPLSLSPFQFRDPL